MADHGGESNSKWCYLEEEEEMKLGRKNLWGPPHLAIWVLCLTTECPEVSSWSIQYLSFENTKPAVGLPGGTRGKEPTCQCRRGKRLGLNPGSGRSPGGGHGSPLQHSCLENPIMDRGAWRPMVHRVTKSPTRLKLLMLGTHASNGQLSSPFDLWMLHLIPLGWLNPHLWNLWIWRANCTVSCYIKDFGFFGV